MAARLLFSERCLVIAEVGLNHNGDMGLACEAIQVAAAAGADGVKFQNYRTEDFITDRSLEISYTSQGRPNGTAVRSL